MPVTRKPHDAVLPLLSVATHVTDVPPTLKADPDGGVHCTVITATLSNAYVVHVAEVVALPMSRGCTMLLGHEIVGGCLSCTVMEKVQLDVRLAVSVAVQLMIEVPTG